MIFFKFLKFSKISCHACKLPDAQTLHQVKARERQSYQCEAKHSFCSGKILLCQTNLQILRIVGRMVDFPPIIFAHLAASFPTGPNYSRARGSTSHCYKAKLGEACSRQGAKPPAGPQNFDLLFESDHFFKKNAKIWLTKNVRIWTEFNVFLQNQLPAIEIRIPWRKPVSYTHLTLPTKA